MEGMERRMKGCEWSLEGKGGWSMISGLVENGGGEWDCV